jgi:biotin transport system substrate-specific component
MSFARTLTLEKTTSRDILLVLGASFLICLSGKIAIPLWFTPVPIATQNSVILILAALLGSRRGAAATFLFLFQGAMGLPVFSTSATGFAYFFGPTGGYLIGYLIASFVVGYIAERNKTLTQGFLAMAVGNLVIYVCGASYLATFVGSAKAFTLGIAPFLLGDLLKIIAGLNILKWAGWSRS